MTLKKVTSLSLIVTLIGIQVYPLIVVQAVDLTGTLGLTGYQPAEDITDVVNLAPVEASAAQAQQNSWSSAGHYQTDQFTGAATYTYPLTLPPFRKELGPKIALQYSSQGQQQASWLGYGWSLTWASIERHQQGGIENLYTSNSFYANIFGQSGELVAYDLEDTEHGEYRLRYETGPYWRFIYQTDGSWTAINQAGVAYQLGSTASARQADPADSSKVYQWMIDEIRDPNDSSIAFSYISDDNQLYPSTIEYGPIIVTFSYVDRPDAFTNYSAGFAVQTNYLLSTVSVNLVAEISTSQQRTWTFAYGVGDNAVRSVLSSITAAGVSSSGAAVVEPATTFSYSTHDTLGFNYTSTALPVAWTDRYTNYDTGARIFDINADGFDDIVQSYYEYVDATGAEELINHVYLNNRDATWSENADWSFPEGFVTHHDRGNTEMRTIMNLIDLNNNGLTDITAGESFEQTDQPIYLHTGLGYEADNRWATAAGMTTYNGYGADTGRRFVDVNGDSYIDMIRSYRYETRNSPTVLTVAEQSTYLNNPTIEDFETSALYTAPVEFTYLSYGEETSVDNGARFVDVNGDGLVDIIGSALNIHEITTLSDEAWDNNYVYLNNGQGGWELSTWQLPAAVVWTWGGTIASEFLGYTNLDNMANTYFDGGVRFIDLNADGLTDLVKSDGFWAQLESSLNTYYFIDSYSTHDSSGAIDYPATGVYLNNGVTGWDEVTDVADLPTFTDADWAFDRGHRLADANGDGQVDVLYNLDDVSFQGVYQNMAAPADLLTTVETPTGGTTSIEYTASNTDGSSMTIVFPVVAAVETDSGFGDNATTTYTYTDGIYHKYDTYHSEFGGFAEVTVTSPTKVETTTFNQGQAHYGLKGKTVSTQSFSPGGSLLEQNDYTWETTTLADDYYFIALTKKVNLVYDGAATHRDRAWQYVYDTSTGNQTAEQQLGEATAQPAGQDYEVTTTTSESDNLVAYYNFSEGSGTSTADQSSRGHTMVFNGLSTWESGYDGYAANVDWNYEYLEANDHDDFDLGNAYTISAWLNLNNPLYNSRQWILAKKYLPPYSANTAGYYLSVNNQQLEWNICSATVSCATVTSAGTVPLGAWVHVAVVSDGETVRLYINGIADANTIAAIDPGDTTDSLVLGANQDNLSNTFLDGSIDEVRVYKDRAYETINDLVDADIAESSSVTETLTTDSAILDTLAGDERTISSSYTTDAANWIVTLAERHTNDATGSQVSAASYDYDAAGNMITESHWLDTTAQWLNTTFTIGDYGMVVTETNPRGYTTTTAYDAYDLYPAVVTNPLFYAERYAHDYLTGWLTSLSDKNGYTTEYGFDGLGRPISQAVPDPTTGDTTTLSETSYDDRASADGTPAYIETITTTDDVQQHTRFYFDGFGDVLQEWQPTEAATPTVVDYWYDDQHRLVRQSLPYAAADSNWIGRDTSAAAVTHEYDALNRLTSEAWPVGTTTYAWSHWQKTKTDANGDTTTYFTDAYDNTIQIDEVNGSNTYITTATYDAANNLVQLIDAQGNERNFTYDSLGRKQSQQDLHIPTATTVGTWQWEYDVQGNRTTQTDPTGQIITWDYDSLDRMTTEDWNDDGNIDIAYAYDSATNGVGELAQVVMADNTTSYAYDAQGNSSTETRIIADTTYTTQTTYDLLGRERQTIYPAAALTVDYTYNAAGKLETVTKDATETIITNQDYSPAGQSSYVAYGNGTATTNTFTASQNYRLTNKVTTGIYDSDPDIDRDGLTQTEETNAGTDVNDADTDDDGLIDGVEVDTYGTDPAHIDSTVYNSNDNDDFGGTYNSSDNVALNKPVELLMSEILSEEEFAAYEETNAPYTVDYPPEYLVDGSSSTLAFSAYNTLYYEIDLEGSYPLENIWVAWQEYGNDGSSAATYMTDWILAGITAEGSEITLADQGSPDSSYSLVVLSETLADIEFSKLRIYAAGDNWLGMYELAAYAFSTDYDGDGVANDSDLCADTAPLDASDTVDSTGCTLSQKDTDTDGLSDYAEIITHGTDPNDADTDNDLLEDGDEVNTHGTNPTLFDTDSNGLPDSIASADLTLTPYSPDPTIRTTLTFTGHASIEKIDDALMGVNIIQVEYSVSGSTTVDWTAATATDGSFETLEEDYTLTLSGLTPGTYTVEVRLVSAVGTTYLYTNNTSDTVTVRSASSDTDGDGVSNTRDRCAGTSPIDASDTVDMNGCALSQKDTDLDGLTNYQETVTYLTSAIKADTDGDGLNDYAEVMTYGTNPLVRDTDGDRLTDSMEVNTYLTDPLDSDTDDDGRKDGAEVRNGRDPNDPLALAPLPQWLLWLATPAMAATTAGNIQELSYEYDAVGNIIQITDAAVTPTAKIVTYTYDDLDRLLTAQSTGLAAGDYSQSYAYDALGNMTYKSDIGTLQYTGTSNPSPHAITAVNETSYTYDTNGNLLSDGEHAYTWNIKNQLTAADEMMYSYDHAGQRVSATNTTTVATTAYVNRYMEVQPDKTIYYIWAEDVRVAASQDGDITYYYQDHLGSTQVAAQAGGFTTELFDYYPYGELVQPEHYATYSFSDKAFDDTSGLYYFEARYYNPAIGRFVSQDPLLTAYDQLPSVMEPLRWNGYAYALNNPLRYIDAFGLEASEPIVNTIVNTVVDVAVAAEAAAAFEGGTIMVMQSVDFYIVGQVQSLISGDEFGINLATWTYDTGREYQTEGIETFTQAVSELAGDVSDAWDWAWSDDKSYFDWSAVGLGE